ncbi:hypothetical protein HMPREF7215_2100 [Pyramidobacter piscolens W5455]|uniref:Uncharacterized protein n=1 Tax=Pyramidobacter piscolens W5455 TaxID=352165 RepID=A0ABM9ZU85_9BACT|nr:hypothetical protein HMPREF7215_2100 [Pyramidobacter piscolens W5455]
MRRVALCPGGDENNGSVSEKESISRFRFLREPALYFN